MGSVILIYLNDAVDATKRNLLNTMSSGKPEDIDFVQRTVSYTNLLIEFKNRILKYKKIKKNIQ